MKRIVNIAKDHDEAKKWDIKQANKMTHEERQEVAAILKRRVYGDKPDVRESHLKEDRE